jgi:hypothetical protein
MEWEGATRGKRVADAIRVKCKLWRGTSFAHGLLIMHSIDMLHRDNHPGSRLVEQSHNHGLWKKQSAAYSIIGQEAAVHI